MGLSLKMINFMYTIKTFYYYSCPSLKRRRVSFFSPEARSRCSLRGRAVAGVRKEEARVLIRISHLSVRVLYVWRGSATHVVIFALLNWARTNFISPSFAFLERRRTLRSFCFRTKKANPRLWGNNVGLGGESEPKGAELESRRSGRDLG